MESKKCKNAPTIFKNRSFYKVTYLIPILYFKFHVLSYYPVVIIKKNDSLDLIDSQDSGRGKFYSILQILIKKNRNKLSLSDIGYAFLHKFLGDKT